MMSKKEKALEKVGEKVENMLRFILNNKELIRHYIINHQHTKEINVKKFESKNNYLKRL